MLDAFKAPRLFFLVSSGLQCDLCARFLSLTPTGRPRSAGVQTKEGQEGEKVPHMQPMHLSSQYLEQRMDDASSSGFGALFRYARF